MHHTRHFRSALVVAVLSIFVFSAAFFTESSITGQVAHEQKAPSMKMPTLHSLNQLSQGTYYIDLDGVVFWMDDSSRPAIGKLNGFDTNLANRQFYVSSDGRVNFI